MRETITFLLLGIFCMTADSPDIRAWLKLTAILLLIVGVINCVKVPRKLRKKAPRLSRRVQLGKACEYL